MQCGWDTIGKLGGTRRMCTGTGNMVIFLNVLMLLWLCDYIQEMKAEIRMQYRDIYYLLSNDSVHIYNKKLQRWIVVIVAQQCECS